MNKKNKNYKINIFIKLHHFLRKLIFPTTQLISLIPRSSSILDLGCGNGFIFRNIENYKSYLGIDINSKKIQKLNIIKKTSLSHFLAGDITKKLSMSMFNKVDTVLLIDVVHHVKKYKQLLFLKKILKYAKKKTIFIIKDIDKSKLITSKWNLIHDLIFNWCFISYFDFEKIKKIKGFVIIKEFTIRKILYDHYFLILKKI
jgi:2-polyprenyl-3-methyl-5-hydroxy-6-metoxy-1,4-benzoquinol methylase